VVAHTCITALRRQEDWEFEDSLDYTVRICLKKKIDEYLTDNTCKRPKFTK
jgi:hypothetical protein